MDSGKPPLSTLDAANRTANTASAAPNSTSTPHSTTKAPAAPLAWTPQSTMFSSQNGSSGPNFPQFSASTTEILKRLQSSNHGHAAGTPAFEAKRAEVLQNYVTSDKLPTPQPLATGRGSRRGGGRVGTPSTLKTEVGAGSTSPAPSSARGSGRGRGRGRGRGGGRGGKRKRSESVEESDDDDSDISSSYTPLPTRTKSGRNVNKPVAFVPTLPEPTPGVKRRRSTKTILAAQCNICHRGTDPGNNRIVFCDVCSTAYHQYCHDPPIENEVVNVLEKEWLCGPCERSKKNVIEGTENLVAGEGLSIEDKRAYFSTLSQPRLVSLLLHSTIRHPELPIFPPDVHDLIPATSNSSSTTSKPSAAPPAPPSKPLPNSKLQSITSPPNGTGSTGGTPRSQNPATDSSDLDSAEAQLIGESRTNKPPTTVLSPLNPASGTTTTAAAAEVAVAAAEEGIGEAEFEDGYDTDPPAHYPKAGNGLARTLRPESEDLQWLVDDNFEVFSHGWKGDGSGLGADSGLNGEGLDEKMA